MYRQVVTDIPKGAVQVLPLDKKPFLTETRKVEVEVEGNKSMEDVQVEVTWPLDPDVARLVGEAKSLPKGRYLRLSGYCSIVLYPREVAWYVGRHKMSLLQASNFYFIGRGSK